jgi:hypothetical protein
MRVTLAAAAALALAAFAFASAPWPASAAGGDAAPRASAHAPVPPGQPAPPSPEQIQFAAHEHDLGYRAYVARQYDEAATHFENAFFAAPNPAELRSAVRARRAAGQLARAATLAAIGQRKYPDDAALGKLAAEIIAEARPHVFEVHITSSLECNVAVDEKIVAGEKVKDFRFFVDPGKHELLVGWSEDRTRRVLIDARAAGGQTLTLEPPAPRVPAPPAAVVATSPASASAPASALAAAPSREEPASRKPFAPAVFLVGLGLTVAGAGVTTWSAIDTLEHPGADTVRTACVGQGTGCPQYQQGLDSQRRTNILLAATGGVALVTAVVGVFFTQWSRANAGAAPAKGTSVQPLLGWGRAGIQGAF